MYVTYGFNSIEPIELESSSIEGRSKIIVAGEVLILNLEFRRSVGTIIHVGGVIHRISHTQPVLRILRVAFGCMELGFLLVA